MKYRKLEPYAVEAFLWTGDVEKFPYGEPWVLSAISAGIVRCTFETAPATKPPCLTVRIGNSVTEVPAGNFVVKGKDDVFSIVPKPEFKAAYIPESGAWPDEEAA